MKYVLGIDVGGTSIKAGIFTLEGQLKAVRTIPTSDLTTPQAFAEVTDGLTNLVSSVDGAITDVEAVGLDIPGPVDANGNVGFLPNIKLDPDGLKNALKETFFQARLAFVNDANAAALGEMWMGGAKGVKNFIMITLGTGVGGGVVLNGQLVAGANGAGGELGHLTMNYEETRTCGCGRHGCLEQYASASGIVTLYKEACEKAGKEPCALSGRSDSYSVFKAMAAGDECARTAISQMGVCLGPVCMLAIGVMLAETDLKKCFSDRHLYLLIFLRLIALPLCAAAFLLVVARFWKGADKGMILMITLLGSIGPGNATITQFSMLADHPERGKISSFTAITTLLSAVTIPLIILLFRSLST